ncbi:LysM domain protein [Candidatus Xiphinematobacter sp. Idaho Grape]|nr:LysM domain protein [Candidatus Xiphinematobacter sp. Idaho Grape]
MVVAWGSLAHIASKFGSSAELIFRVNNLTNINLRVGQQLLVPQLAISILIDGKSRTLTLLNHGRFFLKGIPHCINTDDQSIWSAPDRRISSLYEMGSVPHSGTKTIFAVDV